MPSRKKKSIRKSLKNSVRKSSKKTLRKSVKKSVRKSVKKSVGKSKRGVKFGVKRITNCNPLQPIELQKFLDNLNTELLTWGKFLLDKESVDKQKYYTYFYNIRGTTQNIRQAYKIQIQLQKNVKLINILILL